MFYMNACEYAFCILALVHIRKIKTTRVRVIERLCRISVLLKAEPEVFCFADKTGGGNVLNCDVVQIEIVLHTLCLWI